MKRLYVKPGSEVISEGELGDCAYIIESGRLEVTKITEQNNRLFKGYVIHKGGKEAFVGVIRSDYINFYWADSGNDDGKVIGTILKKNKIETCYLDSGRDAVVGCSILLRK